METTTETKKRPRDGGLDSSDPNIARPLKRRRIQADFESPNIVLPPEIMREIFQDLPRNDLLHCMAACKYWYQNVISVFHGWMLVWKDVFSFKYSWGTKKGWWIQTRYIGGIMDRFSQEAGREIFLELVDRKIIVASPNPQAKLSSHKSKYWKFVVTAENSYHRSTAKLYFNTKTIEHDVQQGHPIDNEDLIIDALVSAEVSIFLKEKSPLLLDTPKAMFPFIPPKRDAPKGLKQGSKFHRYQLDAINWMLSVEEEAGREFKYCVLVPWRASRLNVLVSLQDAKFVLPSNMSEYIGSVKAKGGILADAVGLGKTVEIIGLTLSSYTKEKLPDFDEATGLLNTKATLVVCPNHLHQQWCEQIEKYTDLKVVKMTVYNDYAELTFGDIATADFIIVPATFIKNRKYFSVGCAGTEFGRGGVAKRKKLLEKHLATIKKNKTFSTLKEPVLDLFLFNRIIIDEAHEVLADPLVTDLITSIPKRFGWYVSATPFPSEKLYTAAKIFLEILPIDFVDEKTIAGEYESYVENDIVYNNLVWRNTKESIHEEYLVPEYEEKLVEIDFTSIEQLVHDHDYFADKLALCSGSVSGPILDDLRDLQINEVKDMIKESKSEIERLKSQLKLLENHIQVAKEKIEEIDAAGSNYSTSMKKQEMQHRLNNFEYNRDDRQMALEREEKRLVEFESLSEKWSKTEYLLKGKEIRDNKQLAHLKLLNARGSKLTKLIEWLRESISKDKENRFIIFSKYTEYLYNIQNILRENKINSVTVEGTSAQKVKAIQQFKEENIKVIMLSLEKSASGLNLIEANHVVLLDPMDGTVEEARAVEVQALGRAHRQGQDQKVTLVRLVIKNSAEEELYLRNKSSGRDSKQGANNKSGKPILAKSNSATSLRNLAVFNEE